MPGIDPETLQETLASPTPPGQSAGITGDIYDPTNRFEVGETPTRTEFDDGEAFELADLAESAPMPVTQKPQSPTIEDVGFSLELGDTDTNFGNSDVGLGDGPAPASSGIFGGSEEELESLTNMRAQRSDNFGTLDPSASSSDLFGVPGSAPRASASGSATFALGIPADDDDDLPLGIPADDDDDLSLGIPADDLPAPSYAADSGVMMPVDDLPAPGRGASDIVMPVDDLPTPPVAFDDLPVPAGDVFGTSSDLPMPDDLDDLPVPADDLPISVGDLPMPGDFSTVVSLPDLELEGNLPASRGALPELGDIDLPGVSAELPTPSFDLPTPGFDDGIDALPDIGVDLGDLPTSGAQPGLPTPSLDQGRDLPTASLDQGRDLPGVSLDQDRNLPAPAGDIDLDFDVDEPETGSVPEDKAKKDARAELAQELASTPPNPKGGLFNRSGSPSPKKTVSPVIIYGGLAALVVAALGYGALEFGLLDPSGGDPNASTTGGGDSGQPDQAPPTEIKERPEGVLARFDQDTPGGYIQSVELGPDPVAQAEAALLLHLRYGPDPEQQARAGQLLETYKGRTEPHIRRVFGLAALAAGQRAEALTLFGDDGRGRLYRAWVQLEKGELDAADESARAVIVDRPDDRAAGLILLETKVARDPELGFEAMAKAAEASPDHLALRERYVELSFANGLLADAAESGRKLQPGVISKAHKAGLLLLRARIAIAQGDRGDATRLLEQAVASDEGALEPKLMRLRMWISANEFASVRGDLDVMLRENPSDPEVLMVAAEVALAAGKSQDAKDRLSKIPAEAQGTSSVQLLLGEIQALDMEIEIARQTFTKALEIDPSDPAATLAEVALLVSARQIPEAQTLLAARDKALVDAGESAENRKSRAALALALGRLLVELEDVEGALQALERSLALDSSNNITRLLRAELLAQVGAREDHEKALLELWDRTGGFPGLTRPLGRVYLRRGELDKLEALIGNKLDDPDASAETLLTGAALRLAQTKNDQGLELIDRVLQRDPNNSRAHLLKGQGLLATGEKVGALAEIERAQGRKATPEVEMWLGKALEYNKRPDEARAHYTKALELDPTFDEAAVLLGRLYAYAGAAKQAIDLIGPVVDRTDGFPYAYLSLGISYADLGQRAKAIDNFQKAYHLDETLFEAYYREGRMHSDRNQHSAGVKALGEALDKAIQNAQPRDLIDAWRLLGLSYFRLGRKVDAKKAFQKYLELAPASDPGQPEVARLMRGL